MKGVVEGQCGQSNALVGMANTIGTSNQRQGSIAGASASSFMPSSSLGEQMASEFLKQQAGRAAPTSFNMSALQRDLPTSSSQMAAKWTQEFQPAHAPLANQWANQYTSKAAFNSAWQSAAPMIAHAPQSSSASSGMWSSEYLDNFDTKTSHGVSKEWMDEYLETPDTWTGSHNEQVFESAWNEVTNQDDVYRYQDVQNPFEQHENPTSVGDSLMAGGDIGNAMLAYEQAVKNDPNDAMAWCRLGLANAENEKDQAAIVAFNKCLQIDPNNQQALLALSVSLANEGLENQSLHQLDTWISSYLGNNSQPVTEKPLYSSFFDHEMFERVENRFLEAARQQTSPDPELQNALGILYNLNRNFDRAVDSLKVAISAKPEDARLWNRLGATLANGDRTAEAISAYREALSRYPTYVRARYNLGISCMQLSSYREAIDHFTTALELQKGGNDGSSIWSTMRSAAIRTKDASDELLRAIENRDLNAVKSAIGHL